MDRIYVMQLVRSFQLGELSRRSFLKRAGVALGSMSAASMLLAACQPISGTPRPVTEAVPSGEGVGSPETSMTTEAGLTAGVVEYAGPDGETLMGYMARPEGDEPLPAVIVLQEWWGLNEHIMDVTRRIANEGYVALAPDLYKGQVATEPDEARKLGHGIGHARRSRGDRQRHRLPDCPGRAWPATRPASWVSAWVAGLY